MIGGVHGNEPSGVVALTRLLQELQQSKNNGPVQGRLVGLRGNCQALHRGSRCIYQDLNRLWTEEHVERLRFHSDPPELDSESREQGRLLQIIEPLLDAAPGGQFYLLDLHSTSGHSAPFSIVNHQPSSRRLASLFPVPMVFGLHDEIPGTLVSYFDSRGIPALGFEGGRHESKEAVLSHPRDSATGPRVHRDSERRGLPPLWAVDGDAGSGLPRTCREPIRFGTGTRFSPVTSSEWNRI